MCHTTGVVNRRIIKKIILWKHLINFLLYPIRQRTISGSSPVQNFIFPGVAASPPKFMSLEEVMKAAKGVSNMVLAHEIAVDRNFKLEKFDPPDNSVEKQVRQCIILV